MSAVLIVLVLLCAAGAVRSLFELIRAVVRISLYMSAFGLSAILLLAVR